MFKVWQLTRLLQSVPAVVVLQLRWTRLSRPFLTRKWQPYEVANVVEAGVAVVELGAAVEDAVLKIKMPLGAVPAPSIQIFLLETSAGVECISNMGKMHFSVVTHPRVLGRMSIPKSLQNNEK